MITETITRKLRYHRYAERTIEVYCHYINEFLSSEKVSDPYQVSIKQIESYLENRSYSSSSVQNQIIGALKVFAKLILKRSRVSIDKIERVKKSTSYQPIIPIEVIKEKLCKVDNLKHKVILSLGYGCALRVSEVINLKWSDIDRESGVINIVASKGNKDRIVPLSDNMICLLEDYYREYRTKGFVLSGAGWRPKYSSSSCNAIVKRIFGNKYRFHSLRKSASNHLYNLGNDLAKIQDLLGHKNEATTRIYVDTSVQSIKQLTELV
jgi:integrase